MRLALRWVKNCRGYFSAVYRGQGGQGGQGRGRGEVGHANTQGYSMSVYGGRDGAEGLGWETHLLCRTFFNPKATTWSYGQQHMPRPLEP